MKSKRLVILGCVLALAFVAYAADQVIRSDKYQRGVMALLFGGFPGEIRNVQGTDEGYLYVTGAPGGGIAPSPPATAPLYFFNRYTNQGAGEVQLVAPSATEKYRVMGWLVTVKDGSASGTLHFGASEATGPTSNVFGHFDSGAEGGVFGDDDASSPLLWDVVNQPLTMKVEAQGNTYTRISISIRYQAE